MSTSSGESQYHIETLHDLLGMMKAGERFVICVPTRDYVETTLQSILIDEKPGRRAVPRLLFSPEERFASLPLGLRWIKRTVPGLHRDDVAVVNASIAFGAWYGSPGRRRTFHSTLVAALASRRIRSLWVIPAELLTEEEIVSLRNEANLFLQVTREETHLVAQVLAATRIADPRFFLPRIITFSTGGSAIAASPLFPSPLTREGAAAQGRYGRLLETTGDAVAVFSLQGGERDFNRKAADLLGYSHDEFMTLQLHSVIPADKRWALLKGLVLLRRKGKVELDTTLLRKSGPPVHVRVRASTLDSDTVIAALEDRTQRVRTEAALAEFKRYDLKRKESIPYPAAVFVNRELVYGNAAFRQTFPQARNEGARTTTLSAFFGRRNAGLLKMLNELAAGQPEPLQPLRHEVALGTSTGETLTFEITAQPVIFDAKRGVECLLVDVTPRQTLLAERDDAETRFRDLLENSMDAVSLCEGDKILRVNRAFLQMFGIASPDQVSGKSLPELVAADKDRPTLLRHHGTPADKRSGIATYSYQGVKRDGTHIHVEAATTRIALGGGSKYLTYHRDTTERVNRDHSLDAKTKGLEIVRSLVSGLDEAAGIGEFWHLGLRSALKVLGFEEGAVLTLTPDGKELLLVEQAGMRERVLAAFRTVSATEGIGGYVLKTSEPLTLDSKNYPPFLPFKSLFETEGIRTVAFVPMLSRGKTLSLLMLCSSKEKQFDVHHHAMLASIGSQLGLAWVNLTLRAELAASQERFQGAVNRIGEVLYSLKPDGSFAFLSSNVEGLLGYKASEFTASPEMWRRVVHPDDRATVSQRIAHQLGTPDTLVLQYRVTPRGKATHRWVRDALWYTRDKQGKLISIDGVVSDITEKLILERALTNAEEAKSNVLESVREGVVVFDVQSRCIEWNTTMETLTGVVRHDALGRVSREAAPLFASEKVAHLLQRVYAGEENASDYVAYETPATQEPGELWVRFSPLRDKEGKTLGVVGILSDVTNERRLERDVRESEETLRNTINAMGDALMISDLQGKVWEVNTEFCRLTGYDRAEALGAMFPYPWLVDEEMASFVRWISELREKNELRDFDMNWRTKDEQRLAISLNTTLLRNAMGEPVAMLNIARDITERKRLASELERRNEELTALNAISTSLTRSLDLDEVLRVAAGQIRKMLHADYIVFYLLEPSRRQLLLAHQSGVPAALMGPLQTLDVEHSLTGSSMEQGKPLFIERDVASHPLIAPPAQELMKQLNVQSLGVIPLQSKQRVLGAMEVAFIADHSFSPAELQVLPLVGNQVAANIENARLYSEVQAQVERVSSLYELGKALTGELDPKALLQFAYERVAKTLPVERFLYYRWAEQDGLLRLLAEITPTEQRFERNGIQGREITMTPESPYWSVITHGKSFVNDEEGTAAKASMFAVPVRTKHLVAGALAIELKAPRICDESYLRLLESIANLTEIAIDKAMLYEDTIAKSTEIEHRNRELDDFTYVVSHDLKEPLISIEGFSKILLTDFGEGLDAEGKEYLQSIVHSTDRMKALIDDLLKLSRIGRVTDKLEAVAVNDVVGEILHDLQFQLMQRKAVVKVDGHLPTVRYSRTNLSVVFRNLISNALKFNDKPEPVVTIQASDEGKHFVFSVADNGIGIEKKYFEKVFQIFQRLQRSEEYRGTGAGLTIVKKVIETHRGRIWVESEPGRGTTFYFTILKDV